MGKSSWPGLSRGRRLRQKRGRTGAPGRATDEPASGLPGLRGQRCQGASAALLSPGHDSASFGNLFRPRSFAPRNPEPGEEVLLPPVDLLFPVLGWRLPTDRGYAPYSSLS